MTRQIDSFFLSHESSVINVTIKAIASLVKCLPHARHLSDIAPESF